MPHLGRSPWAISAIFCAGLILANPALALTGLATAAGLGASQSIKWGQLGSDFTLLSGQQAVKASGGLSAVVSSAGNTFYLVSEGDGWVGNFTTGEALLWDAGVGPDITVTFNRPVKAVGARIQADSYGGFTAKISGANAGPLGNFSLAGNSDTTQDGALFIGLTGGGITSVRFELSSASSFPEDFAIGTLSVAPMPEPGSWATMLVGFALSGLALRARRVAATIRC